MTRTDQGNPRIMLNKNDYEQRSETFLWIEKLIILKKDPTKNIQNKLKTILKKSTIFPKKYNYEIINLNSTHSKPYGFIKIYKEKSPPRPIISYINSLLRNVAIHLSQILKDVIKFQPKYSIRNFIELYRKLELLIISDNSCLISFNVGNMFLNIINADYVERMEKKVLESNTHNKADSSSNYASLKIIFHITKIPLKR